MTGAGAVAQLADGVLYVRSLYLLVRSQFVVARVTARTVRLKCSVPPGNEFRVGLVAVGTREVATVIERLVGQSRVPEVRWGPGVRVMAGITFLRRQKVTRILAGRDDTIVTGETGAQNLIMIYGQGR